MSSEHDPQVSSWKVNAKFDEISCAKTHCQGQTSVDRSSKTIDKIENVSGETIESLSEDCAQKGMDDAGKCSQGTPEDSHGDSCCQRIERSQGNSVSKSNESLTECTVAEPGSCSRRANENVAERSVPTATWGTLAQRYQYKQQFGMYESLSSKSDEKYFTKLEKTPTDPWKMKERSLEMLTKYSYDPSQESPAESGAPESFWRFRNDESLPWRYDASSPRTSTFTSLALDVSYAGLDTSGLLDVADTSRGEAQRGLTELWEDYSVVECLEKRLSSNDESTPEERVEALKEVLADNDIHEGDGVVPDFLFHVARTKHGKIYIRVIRTMLVNRGRI